jgi:tetratricopeptide (TPR) repeat protein
MSTLHIFRGEFDEAETNLTRLLAIREKASGPASFQAATVLDDLGDLYAAMTDRSSSRDMEAKVAGQPKEEWPSEQTGKKAEAFYKRSLAIREKALKPGAPDIVESLYNLGQLAAVRQQPADVEKYLARWLELQEAAKAPAGERHPKVLFMLASASLERKDWAEAERRLAMSQKDLEELKGAGSDEVSTMLASRADVALLAARFDDAEEFLKKNLEVQAAILGPEDRDIVEARTLMAGSYRDHVEDRRVPLLWHQFHVVSNRTETKGHHWNLGAILNGYARLLRRTNRVLPQPTEEDLAYLKKAGVVLAWADLGFLTTQDSVLDSRLDDEGMKHIARLYEVERLSLRGITDAGLAHITGLINLRDLSLSNSNISDAGLAPLAGLENLEHLNVMMTRVGDIGLAHLKGLKKLRELNLAFTSVTDAGLKHLEGLKSLHSLDIKGTRITAEAVSRLRRARPDLQIEHEPGPGVMQPMVPAGFRPGVPPDAAVPTRPAALAPPPQPPRRP